MRLLLLRAQRRPLPRSGRQLESSGGSCPDVASRTSAVLSWTVMRREVRMRCSEPAACKASFTRSGRARQSGRRPAANAQNRRCRSCPLRDRVPSPSPARKSSPFSARALIAHVTVTTNATLTLLVALASGRGAERRACISRGAAERCLARLCLLWRASKGQEPPLACSPPPLVNTFTTHGDESGRGRSR